VSQYPQKSPVSSAKKSPVHPNVFICICIPTYIYVLQTQRLAVCIDLKHAAARWITLQHAATHCNTLQQTQCLAVCAACNTLQLTANHCNSLQRTATHYKRCSVSVYAPPATQCSSLQLTATHCDRCSVSEYVPPRSHLVAGTFPAKAISPANNGTTSRWCGHHTKHSGANSIVFEHFDLRY